MSDKYPGTLLPQDESASENSKAFLDILKKINEVSAQASLNGPSGSNVVKVYDFTTGDQAQSPNDTAFNVIELTGALAGNVNFTLAFNASSLIGRKQYTIINKATTTVFGRYITVKTSIGILSINIMGLNDITNTYPIYNIYIDKNGNVSTSGFNLINTGSNVNGYYEEFSNGLIIQRGTKNITTSVGLVTSLLGVFQTYRGVATLTWPIPFKVAATIRMTGITGYGSPFLNGAIGITTVSIGCEANASNATVGVDWMAIGY